MERIDAARVTLREDRIVIVLPLSPGFRALPPVERERELEAALSRVLDSLRPPPEHPHSLQVA